MKKIKKLLLLPICLSLLTGCKGIEIKYYKDTTSSSQNSNNSNNSNNNNNNIEDFFNDSQTTFIDNSITNTLETLYEICKKATVTIEIYVDQSNQGLNKQGVLYSSGSGFIAKESENYLYIYTNSHVISVEDKSASNIKVEVILSDHSRYNATIVANDSNEDVGIIKISKPSTNNFLIAAIGDSTSLNPGEQVFAIGSPLGLDYASSITSGIVSATDVSAKHDKNSLNMYLIQTDTAINPGNSGGPLFNLNGEVIGVNTLKITESKSGVSVEGMGFAIPINHFTLVTDTIIKGETFARPLLGIQVASIPTLSLDTRKEYGITIQHGLYIASVDNQNSPLIKNTVITHLNNKPVSTFSSFSVELYNHKKGDTISITYTEVDGSNAQTINVILN